MKRKQKKRTPKKDKKKQIQRNFNLILLALIVFFCFIIIDKYFQSQEKIIISVKDDPLGDVKKYTPLLQKELQNVHLEKYTIVLAALMQQESRGKGGDPMQASESAGLAPNTIKEPEQSIKQGVKHFERTITYGKEKQVDFPTVIQAYNMGIGYIDFVAQHGGKHSEETAKDFSLLQAKKKPEIYNCGGDKNNFRYPYCYGDFTYSKKVTKNIETITESIPDNFGDLTTKNWDSMSVDF
jgi:hypothetical protein